MPTLDELLDAAVEAVSGTRRPGQIEMAHAVADAIGSGEHLLVQAGTGTGKSLAYLVPALAHAHDQDKPVVVATATLALQAQIVDRDLPRLADALAPLFGRAPRFVLVKGRRNYLCVHKLDGGYPEDADALIGVETVDAHAGRLGAEVVRVRRWAESTTTGDRDDLVPGVSERAWRQVSVSARECLGSRCPQVSECFVERARADARDADVIVTNHSFMAIDAFEGRAMLPDHDVLVIDEAHELVDRITSTVTGELTAGQVVAAARRATRYAQSASALLEHAEVFQAALEPLPDGRLHGIPDALAMALALLRDSARQALGELKPESGAPVDAGRQLARAGTEEVFDIAERVLEQREIDVAWVGHDPNRGATLRVAPMSVAAPTRERVFHDRTVVLTSATLQLGGSFDAVAGSIGLRGQDAPGWRGLDVGSPFDYRTQGMVYVAAHLPAPGRDGTAPATLDEIEQLVRAAGGRTLGLFSSIRAATAASEALRERFAADGTDIEVLCQGEDQLATLVRRFARTPSTCLFGTLSLWQGVDVPGSACQLVLIDRIPFPRPDDPLSSARTEAVARSGGNGFMAVSATHAALRLAQGAGRLIRRDSDRGVVAVLDSRLVTARYAGFLQRSLPPFWPTTDPQVVRAALTRLAAAAPPPEPVLDPTGRDGAASAGRPTPVPAAARTAVTGGHAWTAEADGELRDAADAGVDLAELVDHFEIPAELIEARLAQLGLDPGRPALPFD